MTILVLTLVAICLVGGAWATVAEHIARHKIPQGRTRGAAPSRGSRFAAWHSRHGAKVLGCTNGATEHTHVRIVQTPYDREEQT